MGKRWKTTDIYKKKCVYPEHEYWVPYNFAEVEVPVFKIPTEMPYVYTPMGNRHSEIKPGTRVVLVSHDGSGLVAFGHCTKRWKSTPYWSFELDQLGYQAELFELSDTH